MKLDHVGIAVADLAQAMADYRRLGFTVQEPEDLPEQGVRVAFVTLDNTHLELLEPLGPQSPITAFLAKRGPGLHHLAVSVPDAREKLAALNGDHVPVLSSAPKPGAHGLDVIFLHPAATSSKVLLEFCSKRH